MIVRVANREANETLAAGEEIFRAAGTRRECENQFMNWMAEWIDYPPEPRADCLQYAEVCAENYGWEVSYE